MSKMTVVKNYNFKKLQILKFEKVMDVKNDICQINNFQKFLR